jgi:hypothetical protein
MRERSLSFVPRPVLTLLASGLILQIACHFSLPPPQAKAENLPSPPSLSLLKIASFGETIACAKMLMLHLQVFDNQPGINIPLHNLDYAKVQAWLSRVLELDPLGQYPLLAASRIYGEVPDEARQRQMFEFVYQRFFEDPNRRWPWLAHAALTTKHRLKDIPLARKYANAIRLHANGPSVPHWAQQMEIFILEDMSELDSAKILLGALLENGQITDPNEFRFLTERLNEIKNKGKFGN